MSSLVPPDENVQPVDWRTVDDAIYDWATERLDGINAIWENQNVVQPGYPYLSFLRQQESDEGGVDEKRYRTLDAVDRAVGEDPMAGPAVTNEEMAYQPIQFTVTIQAHVDFQAGSTDPGCNAMKLLSKLKRSLGLTSTQAAFSAAGLSIIEPQAVQDLSLEFSGAWVSRGALDVLFRTASVMTERVGFMDKVELKSDSLGVDVIVDAS